VGKVTYSYEYEVYSPDATNAVSIVEDYLNDEIHDAVAKEFLLTCNFDGGDSLWILQSLAQAVEENVDCRGAPPPGLECFVVSARDSIWFYDSPNGRRHLDETDDLAKEFVTDIVSFINDAMNDGVFTGTLGVNKTLYVDDGSNPVVTRSPTAAPTQTPEPKSLDTSVIVGIVLAGCGVCLIFCLLLYVCRPKEKEDPYFVKADSEAIEETMYTGEVDVYTSASPGKRSQREPLSSQDELDRAVGHHRQWPPARPQYDDTVNL